MLFVFMSQPDFACNPHALWKYIKDSTDHDTAWIVKKKEHFRTLAARGIKCAVYDTLAAEKLIGEADYIIQNSYTFTLVRKKENQKLVNLWHGSGVKAHDLFDPDLPSAQEKKLADYFGRVDLMCVHSLDDRFKLSAMLGCDLRKIKVTGQPRLDCVCRKTDKTPLVKLFGEKIKRFDKIIFFVPSYRANMSSRAGRMFSDNVYRLDDYDDEAFNDFLSRNNAAVVYKLHPIEQTAFSGRRFTMNDRCLELTDDMLFDADIRYDEILGAFDIMVSDYSSIAYDFLLLDRPIVYLIPDYDEYRNSKGFVFADIGAFMPGDKAYDFGGFIKSLGDAVEKPDKYSQQRKDVIRFRFDYTDGLSAKRCYEKIISLSDPDNKAMAQREDFSSAEMPSVAQHLSQYVPDNILLIDSTAPIENEEELLQRISDADASYYITGELPDEFRTLSDNVASRIKNLDFYYRLRDIQDVRIAYIPAGVDYDFFFSRSRAAVTPQKRIGFAGTIDDRIYFAMVQCVCEAFPDYEVVFAGSVSGDFPSWFGTCGNLKYISASYDELPEITATFDVAFLPIYSKYREDVPTELYQYLACGKIVVASDIKGLPDCKSIFVSRTVSEAVENIRLALTKASDSDLSSLSLKTARGNDWKLIAERLLTE